MKNLMKNQLLQELNEMAENHLAISEQNLSDEHYCIALVNQLLKSGYAGRTKDILQQINSFMNEVNEWKDKVNEVSELVRANIPNQDGTPMDFKDHAVMQVELIGNVLED